MTPSDPSVLLNMQLADHPHQKSYGPADSHQHAIYCTVNCPPTQTHTNPHKLTQTHKIKSLTPACVPSPAPCCLCLQTKRESNDDRQREYQERLQQHEAKMAQARQKVEAAEVHLGQVQQHKERLRVDIDAKEKEVTQLRNRWAAACFWRGGLY